MIFDEFKGKHISILDWTILENEEDINEYRDTYSIGNQYQIIGSDLTGDILAIKSGFLTIISHEEPIPENDYKLTKELDKVKLLFEKLHDLPDYIDSESIDDLKKIRKAVKECKKIAPKEMKDYFEDAIDEINDEIEFLQD